MSVFEKIYEAFAAGELSIKPASLTAAFHEELPNIKKDSGLTDIQISKIENFLLDIFDDYRRKIFKAGFSLALELSDELSAPSE